MNIYVKMLTDQTLVLQKEYLQKMESFIAQLKLFLSSKVYDETTKVVSWIYQIKQEYEKQYKINNPQFDTNFLEEVYDYNTGEVDKAIFVPNWAWDEFSKNICQLKCDLTPELKVVKSKLYPLCEAMRKDIGSNLK